MKIIFDYNIFSHQTRGGISRYFINLQENLVKKNIDAKIIAPIHCNVFLNNSRNNYVKNIYLEKFPKYTRKIIYTYNNYFSKIYTKFFKPNIVHKTFYNSNYQNDKKIKKVITVYDLIHEVYYKLYNQDKDYLPKKKALENIDYFICPSNKTKSDLIKFYNIPENKIQVIYMGIHKFYHKLHSNFNKIQYPFLLFVGDRKRYKNFDNLIKAYTISKRIKKDFKIIFFGGDSFSFEERKMISNLNINENNLIQINGDDHQLLYLYKNAQAFIFPSKYEGLGLPPLEAMSLGCPVISSNHEAILECVGNAAILFDPNSAEDMSNKMEHVLYSDEIRKELIVKGIERSKIFSWEKCATETLDVYKKISS
jgi:glycosyltransferase involved in cell wall biosynthesis